MRENGNSVASSCYQVPRQTIIAVISIALYLTSKGEHTALYKVNKSVSIKTSKTIIMIIFYSSHTTHTGPTEGMS